ncbi:MAG: hypothetical protein ACREBF_03125 [Candidatus Micrarchaeales archaeon]
MAKENETLEYGRGEVHYHYHSLRRRAALSFALIIGVLAFGTVCLHYIENYSYLNAFYFMSMLATGQGPPISPVTALGKIFASIMAFVSVGSVVFALGFLFGPFFARVARLTEGKLKREEEALINDVRKYKKKL